MRKLILMIFSESEVLWTFFGFSKACNLVYDTGYESKTNGIERLSSNSPQKEQVTTINSCILYSDVFRKPFSSFLSSFV